MRYPEFLKPDGTIGFVAPSFGCTFEPYISRFNGAIEKFVMLGHSLKEGPNSRLAEGIGISNTPEKCGEELNTFYQDDSIDALMSCGGGELMCEVVPFIDFEAVAKAKPKWYMGYSDNTNFIFPSVTIADTAAIYAPCAGDFGMEPWHPAVQDAYDLLTGARLSFHNYDKWQPDSDEEFPPNAPYNTTEPNLMKAYLPSGKFLEGSEVRKTVKFEGRLVGGCLDCLSMLVGTPYDEVEKFSDKYKDDGIIWFLEACDLNVYSIRRAVWQLREAGWFGHVKGFLIGRPRLFGQDMFGLDQYKAVIDILKEFNVPILMDLDIGHLPPMIPMLCGAYAKVSFVNNEFTISYELK